MTEYKNIIQWGSHLESEISEFFEKIEFGVRSFGVAKTSLSVISESFSERPGQLHFDSVTCPEFLTLQRLLFDVYHLLNKCLIKNAILVLFSVKAIKRPKSNYFFKK